MFNCSQFASELARDARRAEVEPFQHQRHNIALAAQRSLDLAPQPVCRFGATFQRRWGQDDKEMRPLGDACVIKEYVVAMLGKVLKDGERPVEIGAAIAEKNGFLDSFHAPRPTVSFTQTDRIER